MIFIDFGVSGDRKFMKITGSSDKRGKDRLGEHKNRANRVKAPLERAPEV